MEPTYSLQDVVKSFKWLGHKGYTELNAIDTTRRHFTQISYATTMNEVVDFVEEHAGSRMVCYSLNPRPRALKNATGRPMAAKEKDVTIVQNMMLDIDAESEDVSVAHTRALATLMANAGNYYSDHGLNRPQAAFTGRGYHLLTALPRILVADVPDIAERQREFRRRFTTDLSHDLKRLEAKVDDTQDLRRMVRIYGTAKPDVGILSRFYAEERVEDPAMLEHLLALDTDTARAVKRKPTPSDALPRLFLSLLERDAELRGLWHGRGKPATTDTSRSGYDYSVISRLLWLGYTNITDLERILSMRPDGGVKGSGKNHAYVTRTIAKALLKIGR